MDGKRERGQNIIFEGVYKSYEELKVIEDLTLVIQSQKILCMVGPSGCGKSTILHLLAGLLQPDQGTINTHREKIGYIFQEDRLLPWENVYENIKVVRRETDHEAIMGLIHQMGLTGFEKSYPHELSGGMRQRCSIARAFYYEPTLLLMDEPFKSLDHHLRIRMVQYLIDLWEKSQTTVVFVTHDIEEALLLGHQVVVLSNRPAKPVKIYDIPIPHKERRITDPYLTDLRNNIIEMIERTNIETEVI